MVTRKAKSNLIFPAGSVGQHSTSLALQVIDHTYTSDVYISLCVINVPGFSYVFDSLAHPEKFSALDTVFDALFKSSGRLPIWVSLQEMFPVLRSIVMSHSTTLPKRV